MRPEIGEPLFHLLPVGDVADVQHQRLRARPVQEVGDRHLAVGPAAELVPEPAVDADRHRRRRQRLLQAGGKRRPVGWMQELAECLTLELGRGVGEEPVDRGADEANHALRIGEHDDVSGVLHQRTEVRFTVAQGGGLRFQLLVERVVVPDHDELTEQDESDHGQQNKKRLGEFPAEVIAVPARYFPTQNVEKMTPSKSSTVVAPVIVSSACSAS